MMPKNFTCLNIKTLGVFLCLFAIFFTPRQLLAQKRLTISGYISDEATGEKLIGAVAYDRKSQQGVNSNNYGFYSLSLPPDSVDLVFNFIGYTQQQLKFLLTKDTSINISLGHTLQMKEVIISAEKSQVENTQMSTVSIPISQIKSIPALLGEVDVLRTIQLLPGVHSGAEGTTGMYVRGGSADQNLILLDGVPVYNVSHLFGFFSVFNADALSSVDLIKGGFPARYGGRLSSVLDIRMKEGNMHHFKAEGSIGLISSKLTIEGPIIKDRTSFIVSGRRTYIDILAKPFIAAASRTGGDKATAGYYFYDLNFKVNHKFSERDRLYLSSYMGDDKAYAKVNSKWQGNEENTEFGLGWGNITTALRWNHLFSPKLFSNTTIAYSRFRFLTQISAESIRNNPPAKDAFAFEYFSGIQDYSARIDFDYIPNPTHSVKFGVHHIYHKFSPGATGFKITSEGQGLDTSFGYGNIFATEIATYIEDDIIISSKLKANMGLHASGFFVNNQFYNSLQPRISARYILKKNWSAKASFASMTQYIHLLSNAGIGLPTDLWVPATSKIKPQRSWQAAAGVAHTFADGYELSVEGYYKEMRNLIEYKDGAGFLGTDVDWQELLEIGKGKAYGAEFFVQKKSGKTTGWLGYTLSWTTRQFDNLNFGKPFFYRFEGRHDIGFVVAHKINDKVDVAATWVYGTGNAISMPLIKHEAMIEGGSEQWFGNSGIVNFYEQRNNFRMKAYHRLDVGINFNKEKKWGVRTWNIGAYNAYSRQNPFFYFMGNDFYGNPKLKQLALFPIIPSITYRFSINEIKFKK